MSSGIELYQDNILILVRPYPITCRKGITQLCRRCQMLDLPEPIPEPARRVEARIELPTRIILGRTPDGMPGHKARRRDLGGIAWRCRRIEFRVAAEQRLRLWAREVMTRENIDQCLQLRKPSVILHSVSLLPIVAEYLPIRWTSSAAFRLNGFGDCY